MEHYLVAMAVTAGIYAILALGTNVIWGMAGLINLGLVGFFAAGAYTSALLTLKLGWPIWARVLRRDRGHVADRHHRRAGDGEPAG